ncbi:lysosomal acid glucosylceramidase-like isoform X2 [Bacillus rossius redtenbacheri]|uniref:lysosomal acid glucosylceramidase-like isoform X2 n=1 Tax=Bacillus rossius redtenbacheri TaxID=93214 RepID=UPI002FDDA515
MSKLPTLFISCLLIWAASGKSPCAPRSFGQDSVVCVCNATYCDHHEPVKADELAGELALHYVSSLAGKRLESMKMKFSNASASASAAVTFTVDRSTKYQEIKGFGGAATDSASINIESLSHDAKERLLQQYFGKHGIDYSFLRVPVGGCDFSPRRYTYDDDHAGDTALTHFKLAEEDLTYKIPVIKRAVHLRQEATQGTTEDPTLKLFSAPWSAPDWMKHIDNKTDASYLLPKYWGVWAQYYLKFFELYKKHGVDFWGYTPHNEPTHGLTDGGFNSMGWQAADLREWTAGHLVPALKAGGFGNLSLMVLDDQRTFAVDWGKVFLGNATMNKLASGMAVHWYADTDANAKNLDAVHQAYSDKFILYTEACIFHRGSSMVLLGSWERAERYAKSILQVINHWSSGWVEWNLALSMTGGPSWYGNSADSPIIVNATAGEFYKQPMFYAIGHFSAFVPPGSRRVSLAASADKDVQSAAFLRPDGAVVVVFLNTNSAVVEVAVKDSSKGSLTANLPARSISTLLYK